MLKNKFILTTLATSLMLTSTIYAQGDLAQTETEETYVQDEEIVDELAVDEVDVVEDEVEQDVTQQQAPDEVGESMEITATFEEGEVVSVVDGEGEAVPYGANVVINEGLTSTAGNQSFFFDTTKTMPWYKIWITNTSTHDYLVNVRKGSPNGSIEHSFYVPAGTKTTYQGDTGIVAQTECVEVLQGQSYPLSGTISVKIGTDVASLG